MTLHRFYIPPTRWADAQPDLEASDAHHAAEVLRLGAGDAITVFDGRGNEASAMLASVSRREVRISLGERRSFPAPRCELQLAQAVPKGKNMDLVLQKAVELGAAVVHPLLSERTVVRLEGSGDAVRKQERWQSIVLEACKQCGQNRLPEVAPPRTYKEFIDSPPATELTLIASLAPGAMPIKEALDRMITARGTRPTSVLVMIGPEGDFTPGETETALAAGAVPVTLGPIVLRTETAAIYCLSVLGHELF